MTPRIRSFRVGQNETVGFVGTQKSAKHMSSLSQDGFFQQAADCRTYEYKMELAKNDLVRWSDRANIRSLGTC